MEQSQLEGCKANEVSQNDQAILKLESLIKEYPSSEEPLCHLQEILRKENPDLGIEIGILKDCLYALCELLVRQEEVIVTLRAQQQSFGAVVKLLKEFEAEIGIDESVKVRLKALEAGIKVDYADREILEAFENIVENMKEDHSLLLELKDEIICVLQEKSTKKTLEEAVELVDSYEAEVERLKEHHTSLLKYKDDIIPVLLRLEKVGIIGEPFRELLKALEAVVEKLKENHTCQLKQKDDMINWLFIKRLEQPQEQEEEPSTSDHSQSAKKKRRRF